MEFAIFLFFCPRAFLEVVLDSYVFQQDYQRLKLSSINSEEF